jgi:hypothetical protein
MTSKILAVFACLFFINKYLISRIPTNLKQRFLSWLNRKYGKIIIDTKKNLISKNK